jgi:hypothetical protein
MTDLDTIRTDDARAERTRNIIRQTREAIAETRRVMARTRHLIHHTRQSSRAAAGPARAIDALGEDERRA